MTIAALRLGALNMAIANLLGSNLFDMLMLAIDDIAYLKGPLLSHVSPIHAVSAFSAVIMTGIVVVGLLYGSKARSSVTSTGSASRCSSSICSTPTCSTCTVNERGVIR